MLCTMSLSISSQLCHPQGGPGIVRAVIITDDPGCLKGCLAEEGNCFLFFYQSMLRAWSVSKASHSTARCITAQVWNYNNPRLVAATAKLFGSCLRRTLNP